MQASSTLLSMLHIWAKIAARLHKTYDEPHPVSPLMIIPWLLKKPWSQRQTDKGGAEGISNFP